MTIDTTNLLPGLIRKLGEFSLAVIRELEVVPFYGPQFLSKNLEPLFLLFKRLVGFAMFNGPCLKTPLYYFFFFFAGGDETSCMRFFLFNTRMSK
ncbi:hypothetical protein Hanom_Chr12g01071251 [Helianthus anomalus]